MYCTNIYTYLEWFDDVWYNDYQDLGVWLLLAVQLIKYDYHSHSRHNGHAISSYMNPAAALHAGASAVRYFMTPGDPTVVSQWFVFLIWNTKVIFKVWLFDPPHVMTHTFDWHIMISICRKVFSQLRLQFLSKLRTRRMWLRWHVIAMTGQEINDKWHKYVGSRRDHLLSHIICDPCDYI